MVRAIYRQHPAQSARTGGGIDAEGENIVLPVEGAETRPVAAIQPGEHLLGSDNRHAARQGGFDDVYVGIGKCARIGVNVGDECAVITGWAEGVIEQGIYGVGVGLPGFVGHVGHGLVHINQAAIQVGELHHQSRAGEQAGTVVDPRGGMIVKVGIEPNAMTAADFDMFDIVAPGHAVRPFRLRGGQEGKHTVEPGHAAAKERIERGVGVIGAVGVDVNAKLVSLGGIGLNFGVFGRSRDKIHHQINALAHAFPILHRTAGWVVGIQLVEAVIIQAVIHHVISVVIGGHHHHCFFIAREVPEARQGLFIQIHRENHIRQQALLLVGLRNGDFIQVDPIGLRVAQFVAVEQICRAGGDDAISVIARPARVALPGEDDRAGQVVGEHGGLPAINSHVNHGHGWAGGGGKGIGVKRGEIGSAAQRVAVCRAVILNGLIDDSRAGAASVDQQVALAERGAPGRRNAEQGGQARVGAHGNQIAAIRHPVGEHGCLRI